VCKSWQGGWDLCEQAYVPHSVQRCSEAHPASLHWVPGVKLTQPAAIITHPYLMLRSCSSTPENAFTVLRHTGNSALLTDRVNKSLFIMALELRVINHLLQYVLTLKAIKRLLTQSL
jgi:hypothetical protein